MSIDKLNGDVGCFRGFFVKNNVSCPRGFFIFELLVSMGVLSVMLLFFARFATGMINLGHDSKARIVALNSAFGVLEAFGAAKGGFSLYNSVHIAKNNNFKVSYKTSCLNITKSNLPDTIKKDLRYASQGFKRVDITVSWKSLSGHERQIKIASGVPEAT